MSEEMKDILTEAAVNMEEELAEADVAAEASAEDAAAEAIGDAPQETPVETMADYAVELEASYKRVREGDILTGTVIGVTEDKVIVDLKYYAEGIISKENFTSNPDCILQQEVHTGDEITATVLRKDDGEGNIVLSKKEANDMLAWEKLAQMMTDRTIVKVKIAEVVKGGAVAFLEGIRGFIPASKLSAVYVEDLTQFSGMTIEATVITVDAEAKKLVLSGKEPALAKLQEEKKVKISKCEVGAVMEGTVDSIKPYGAFVSLENGLSGLLHISQISTQRIKSPGAVIKEGQTVRVKIISTADNKISLSMKALIEDAESEPIDFDYHDNSEITTGLGSLLKGLKF